MKLAKNMKVPDSVRSAARGQPTRSPIILALPFPPSVNNLFVSMSGRRSISPNYRAWREAAADTLWTRKREYITGPVTIALRLKDQGRGDADNCLKGVIDFLVTHGIIDGDSRPIVRKVEAEWCPEIKDGCEVTITPYGLHPVITRSVS